MNTPFRLDFDRLSSPAFAAAAVFLIGSCVAIALIWRLEQDRNLQKRTLAASDAGDHAQALRVGIERATSANYALAALVRAGDGSIANFDEVATAMLGSYPGASEFALAPGGIVRQLVPLEGNQAALGLNVLDYEPQRRESEITRDSGKLTLAGPLELVQGGQALIGRLPVFLDRSDGGSEFWGFTEVAMKLPDVLALGHFESLAQRGYDYELWRIHPDDGRKQIITASVTSAFRSPVEHPVPLPNGDWTLSLAPADGWVDITGLSLKLLMALCFNLLLAHLMHSLLQHRKRRYGLEVRIVESAVEIQAAKNQLEAIFSAIPDLVWLKDQNGVFLNCNRRFKRLLGAEKQVIVGRTDYDFVDKAQADGFRARDGKAMAEDGLTIHEEWLTFASDGYRGLFETIRTPLRDADGKLVGVLGVARDITEHRRRARALHESEMRLTVTLESARIGIWDWDIEHDVWFASPIYFAMLGYDTAINTADRETEMARAHPDDRALIQAHITDVLERGSLSYQYEARMRHADGSYRWVGVRGKVIEHNSSGAPLRMVGVCIDINDLKLAEERAHRLANFDPLTGLPNRALLQAQLHEAIASAQQTGASLALLFIDLDHFKNVNDTLGHSIGDELLAAVAARMRAAVDDAGIVAHPSGDEFVVVLPGADADTAAIKAAALCKALSSHYQIRQYELVITPSIGISMYPKDGDDFGSLLKCADVAMYSAKRSGRNNFQFFTEKMQARVARAMQLEGALRRALERNELSLHYQPQISLEDGAVVGAEALMRWQHPEFGPVSPSEFIPIAEESGLILPIGEWALRSAVTQMKRWLDEGMPLVVAVNLSAVQFHHPHLPERVTQILEAAQLPPQHLELELTERVAMDDAKGAVATMQDLNARGICLSIDDFGTGYSSLSYLKRFRVSKLKIDQSFVRSIPEDADDSSIVASIIGLATSLGIRTVAEGVETADQLAFLRDQGCTEVQGYYFSPALPAADFEAYVRLHHSTAGLAGTNGFRPAGNAGGSRALR